MLVRHKYGGGLGHNRLGAPGQFDQGIPSAGLADKLEARQRNPLRKHEIDARAIFRGHRAGRHNLCAIGANRLNKF